MTNQLSIVAVRVLQVIVFGSCMSIAKDGRTQSIDDVLAKCRTSVERFSSYEYLAVKTSNFYDQQRVFFARAGDSYRYDQKTDLPDQLLRNFPVGLNRNNNVTEFSAGFDGLYYYEYNKENQLERICTPPHRMAQVIEPFQGCFVWLTVTNSRSELLKKSRWDDFARSCKGLVSQQQIEGHSCSVVTSGLTLEGWRYEIAFGEDVGFLPVRVRRLIDDGKLPIGEHIYSDFKHYRIDGVVFYFPTHFSSRSGMKQGGQQIWSITKLKPGTLNINQPIANDLLQLKYDPVGLD